MTRHFLRLVVVMAGVLNASAQDFSNPGPITIANLATASPYPSSITVSGIPASPQTMSVTLNGFSHTSPSDVDVLLVSPSGDTVMLMSDCGSTYSVTNVTLTFDDGATSAVPRYTITSGTYRPTNYIAEPSLPPPAPYSPYGSRLADVVSTNPNGEWRLFICDRVYTYFGQVSGGWTLHFAAAGVQGDQYVNAISVVDLPYSVSGETCSFTDDYDSGVVDGCGASTGKDVVYKLEPQFGRYVDISLCNSGTDYDAKLYIYEDEVVNPPLACEDDNCSTPGHSNLPQLESLLLSSGHTYYIIVDGHGCGTYVLTVDYDCNANGVDDYEELATGYEGAADCNGNNMLDECDISSGLSLDANGNGVPDECEPKPISTSSVTDRAGNAVLTFDPSDPTRAYKGTAAEHTVEYTYTYDDGRLVQIIATPTDTSTPARTMDVVYDPQHPDQVIGVTYSCGCGGGQRQFVYRDARNRVTQITTPDIVSPVVLEQFEYVSATDNRLAVHRRRGADGQLRTVEQRTYTDQGGGAYEVLVRLPVDGSWDQVYRESYTADGRLWLRRDYAELAPSGGLPTSGASYPTSYSVTRSESGGYVTDEKYETIRTSGLREVTERKVTGTPYTAGSTELAQTYLTTVEDPEEADKKSWRQELREYSTATQQYQLVEVNEPTGRVITYAYEDAAHPERVTSEVHSAPGGIGEYADDDLTITYEYDDAGRVTFVNRPGPNGTIVRQHYVYDSFGQVVLDTQDYGGIAKSSEYCYNAFGEQTLTRSPGALVRASVYNNAGRVAAEYACVAATPAALCEFPILTPPTGSVLEHKSYAYHELSGNVQEERVTLASVAPFSVTDPLNPGLPQAITEHTYDSTGVWQLAVSAPYTSAASAWTTYVYDYQGRRRDQISPEGVVSRTIYDGRGSVEQRIITDVGGTDALVTTITYEADGRIDRETRPDGTAQDNLYDAWGRLEYQRRFPIAGGGTYIETAYVRDDAGQVTRTSTPGVRDVSTDYDTWGRTWRVRQRATFGVDDDNENDGNGTADRVRLTEYNPAGSVYRTAIKGPGSTSSPDLIQSQANARDQITRYVYNNVGDVTDVVRSNCDEDLNELPDEVTHTDYDYANRWRIQTVAPLSLDIDTRYDYDALGRTTKVTDPLGHYRTRLYDSRGNQVRETAYQYGLAEPLLQERRAYDERGRLQYTARMAEASSTAATVDRAVDRVVDYEYDDDGRVRFETRYNMNVATPLPTEHTYDSLGRPKKVIDPIGTYVEEFYEPATGLRDHQDRNDLPSRPVYRTAYGYDGHRRLETATRSEAGADPLTTTYERDNADRVTAVIDPSGIRTTYLFDLLGQRRVLVEAQGSTLARMTRYAYDRAGRQRFQTAWDDDNEQYQTTEYRYDLVGRRTRIIYPDSVDSDTDALRFMYDLAGWLVATYDQRGVQTLYFYTDTGQLASRSTSSLHRLEDFQYDGLGRMTYARSRDAMFSPPSLVSLDRLYYTDLGDLDHETQSLFGRLTKTIQYSHDQAGNRLSTGCAPNDVICIEYDQYDGLNRPTQIYRGGSLLAEYQYDGRYLLRRKTHTSQNVRIDLTPTYDEHRRQEVLGNYSYGGSIATFAYGFDAAGNRESVAQNGNDVHSASVVYGYDDLHRLESSAYTQPFPGANGTESFAMDELSNRTAYTDTRDGRAVAYAANSLANEYARVGSERWSYDAAGNRNSVRLFGDLDCSLILDDYDIDAFELAVTNPTQYAIDYPYCDRMLADINGDGEVTTSDVDPFYDLLASNNGREGRDYEYDEQNRLTHAYGGPGDELQIWYDALGRRVRKLSNMGDTYYIYDGQRVLAECEDWYPALRRYYVDGPLYMDEHIAVNDVSLEQERYYFLQELYTVAGLADEAGLLVEAYMYDAYGRVRIFDTSVETQEVPLSPFGNPYYFTGRQLDQVENPPWMALTYDQLYDYRARTYDPVNGRFLQRDPPAFAASANLYEYVLSEPTRLVDPLGLAPGIDGCCGPDVTWQLEEALARIGMWFGRQPEDRRAAFCNGIVTNSSWELVEFRTLETKEPGCATGKCKNSVWVGKACWSPGDVNYAFWGYANGLCSKSFSARRYGDSENASTFRKWWRGDKWEGTPPWRIWSAWGYVHAGGAEEGEESKFESLLDAVTRNGYPEPEDPALGGGPQTKQFKGCGYCRKWTKKGFQIQFGMSSSTGSVSGAEVTALQNVWGADSRTITPWSWDPGQEEPKPWR